MLLPDLSRRLKAKDDKGAKTALSRAAEIALGLTIPSAVALVVIPLPLVSVLFERGATTTDDAAAISFAVGTASLLAYALIARIPLPAAAGLAVGVYGLTQAALQRPFGWLSDRWGRRPVLLLGLALFAVGGVIAATVETMPALIAGRALQGCGAIAGVAMALAADISNDSTHLFNPLSILLNLKNYTFYEITN